MKDKRESERLSQMFSGIEVLAVNPAGQSLKIQLESEIPPSQSRSLEMSALKYVNGSFAVEASLFANPQQVEQQSSDGPIWHEHDQIESADLNDKMETLLELALPLSDISNAIPPPLTSQSQTIGETPIAHLLA